MDCEIYDSLVFWRICFVSIGCVNMHRHWYCFKCSDCRVWEVCLLLPLHRGKSVIMQAPTVWCRLGRNQQSITVLMHLLMVATCNTLRPRFRQLQLGPETPLQRTTHKEVGLRLMIIHSSVIRLEIVMAVNTSVEMVLTIITMGTGMIRTGIIIELLVVEIHMCHQELLQDLYGRLHLLILLSFFIHHQCGHLVVPLVSMVWFSVMMISFNI